MRAFTEFLWRYRAERTVMIGRWERSWRGLWLSGEVGWMRRMKGRRGGRAQSKNDGTNEESTYVYPSYFMPLNKRRMLWLRHLTLSSLSQCHFPSDHGLGVCTEAICRVRVGPCRARLGSAAGLTGYNQFFSGTQTVYWTKMVKGTGTSHGN